MVSLILTLIHFKFSIVGNLISTYRARCKKDPPNLLLTAVNILLLT